MFIRHRPTAPLDAFVEFLWSNERPALAHAREASLPTGCADLVLALGQEHIVRYAGESDREGSRLRLGVLQGPHDRALLRNTAEPSSVIGVHFRPGGAAALLQLPLHEVANRSVSLDEAWGCQASELREQVLAQPNAVGRLSELERWLQRRWLAGDERWRPDPGIRWALQQFDAQPAVARVDAVRVSTGLSERRFMTRFRDQVGLTPKRYCRVRRFQALLRELAQGRAHPWAELALDAGYSDQPHLAHEFARLSGLTPGSYHPVSPDAPNHVAITAGNLQDTARKASYAEAHRM